LLSPEPIVEVGQDRKSVSLPRLAQRRLFQLRLSEFFFQLVQPTDIGQRLMRTAGIVFAGFPPVAAAVCPVT